MSVSYHIWTSHFLAHLKGDQVGLLKTNTAIDQQERPHEAEMLQRHISQVLHERKTKIMDGTEY